MTTTDVVATRWRAGRQVVRAHVREPLFRGGHALVISSALTAAVGVGYWLLAARRYPQAVIGVDSAAISAMTFLSAVAQLNLTSALIRFLPVVGRGGRRLVLGAYGISAAIAALAAQIFLHGIGVWAPGLSFLAATPARSIWFTLSVVAWCLFVLQDAAFTGLGRAVLVPIENGAFAAAKLGLVVVLATGYPAHGVFASWTIALVVTLVPTNLYLFARALPRAAAASTGSAPPTGIVRFVAADYVGSLFWIASTTLLPVLVLDLTGARTTAAFSLAWVIAYSLFLVAANMGSSLVVQAAAHPERLDAYTWRLLRHTLLLIVPAALAVTVAAPSILRLFGPDYEAAAGTLRLLALAAIPNVITAVFVSAARVRRRMRIVVGTLLSLCTVVLVISLVLIPTFGIAGVGWAWLGAETAVAAVLLVGSARHPVLTLARQVFVAARLSAVLPATTTVRVRATLGGLQWWVARRAARARATRTLSVCPVLPGADRSSGPVLVHAVHPTVSDLVVAAIGPADGEPSGILKIARGPVSEAQLRRQGSVLAELSDDPRLGDFAHLFPTMLAEGDGPAGYYLLESALTGADARSVLRSSETRNRMLAAATTVITTVHRRTQVRRSAGQGTLDAWVCSPIRVVRSGLGAGADQASAALDGLSRELRSALVGRELTLGRVHGDFSPGNLLVSPDGGTITGLVDWGSSEPFGLAALDVMQLLLATRAEVERRELGSVVRDRLAGRSWTGQERRLLGAAGGAQAQAEPGLRALLLLSWLRHVSGNLEKSRRYAGNAVWLRCNVHTVLEALQ